MLDSNKIIRTTLIIFVILTVSFTVVCCSVADENTLISTGAENTEDGIYLFDYKDIAINTTSSIGTEIKNCNIYLDMYGDLIILGELENTSDTIKTDIEITIDLMSSGTDSIYTAVVPVKVDYLRRGARYPFNYYFTDKEKYIELSAVKIGVNYREHNYSFGGNPIAEVEEYHYKGDHLVIKGRVVNIGEEKIKDLRLLCTFYDNRDRVVFIKECYLQRERMMPEEIQEFTLEILLDRYLKDFTGFHFEIFFEDEIRVGT